MAKHRLWIIAFGLVMVVYGVTQYIQEQRSNRFYSVLLDFLPQEVTKIDIQKAESLPFSIIRYEDRWLLSQQTVNEEASAEAVEDLLRRLRDIRTSALISQQPSEWEAYGLAPEQGILLCLHFSEEEKTCVRIGRYTFTEEQRAVQAYTRLENQKEVFTINGLALSMFSGELGAFRQNQLVRYQELADSLSFSYQQGDTIKMIHDRDGQFLINKTASEDSLLWINYLQHLSNLRGDQFADDINELSVDSFRYWQLKIFQQGDSVILDCFRDTSRTNPYLLHTNQFPSTWISSDSAGIHQQLIQPWQKWIITNE